MKVRAVKSIPKIQYHDGEKNDILDLLDRFSKSKAKYWEVIYTEDEYASVHSLCESIRYCIYTFKFSTINLSRIATPLYLPKN